MTWDGEKKPKGVLETGGMVDFMTPLEWEVWVCGAQLHCAFDWMCSPYNELHSVFVPWGYDRAL